MSRGELKFKGCKRASAICKTLLASLFAGMLICGCGHPGGNQALTAHTLVQLMDWHMAGFWVINCPIAWIRVTNYNAVAIKDIVIEYNTYDALGHRLDQGTFTFDEPVAPGQTKNFIEQYLGLVNLYTERMSIRLLSVKSE